MSVPLEHDYIGLAETSSMERSSDKISSSSSSALSTTEDVKTSAFNLKETELRLGLPGSHSPERKPGIAVSIFGKDLEDNKKNGYSPNPSKNNPVSGAKRGFSDAIDGSSEKWVFCMSNGSIITPSPLVYPTFSEQRAWPPKTTQLPTLPQPHLMQLQAKTSSSLASLEAFQPTRPHFHNFLTPHLASAPMTSLFPSPKPEPKTPPPPLASSLLSNIPTSSPPTAASPPS